MATETFSITLLQDEMQPELLQLAALDSQAPLTGPVLAGTMNGNIEAAIQLSDGRIIANPFAATTQLTELLAMRYQQLIRSQRFTVAKAEHSHHLSHATSPS